MFHYIFQFIYYFLLKYFNDYNQYDLLGLICQSQLILCSQLNQSI